MKPCRDWTQEEIDALLHYVKTGEKVSSIAHRLKKTPAACYKRLKRCSVDLAKRNDLWSEDQEKELEDLIGKGLKDSQIAKIIGRTRNAVIGKRTRMGIVGNNTPRATRGGATVFGRRTPSSTKITKLAIEVGIDLPVEEPMRDPLTILEVGKDQCRYPIVTTNEDTHMFCGMPVRHMHRNMPYCEKHRQICSNGG